MITYWIDSEIPQDKEQLRWTFFELALRVGIPFKIRFGVPDNQDAPTFTYSSSATGPLNQRPIRGPFSERDGLWVSSTDEGLDPIAGCAALLCLEHEKNAADGHLDGFGRVVPAYRTLPDQPNPQIGYIENTADWLRTKILQRWQLPYTLPWDGETVVVLSHDCDGPSLHQPYQILRAIFKAVFAQSRPDLEAALIGIWTWLRGRPDPFWNFDNWTARESLHNGYSTFFVYAGRKSTPRAHIHDPRYDPGAKKIRTTLQNLTEQGWEVGLHSGIEAYDFESLLRQKSRLEEITSAPVTSCRTHYWSFDWLRPESFWMALQQAGFTADASLSPLQLGLRNGSNLPVMPLRYSSRSVESPLLVFPTQVMDAYLRDAVLQDPGKARSYLQSLFAPGLCVASDWHVRTYQGVGPWKGFDHLYSLFEEFCLAGQAKLVSLRQAEQLWRQRIHRLDLDP